MATRQGMTKPREANVVGYHLLVAALFTGCLPVAMAEWMRTRDGAHRPFAAALDTARSAVAHAYSLPG